MRCICSCSILFLLSSAFSSLRLPFSLALFPSLFLSLKRFLSVRLSCFSVEEAKQREHQSSRRLLDSRGVTVGATGLSHARRRRRPQRTKEDARPLLRQSLLRSLTGKQRCGRETDEELDDRLLWFVAVFFFFFLVPLYPWSGVCKGVFSSSLDARLSSASFLRLLSASVQTVCSSSR